MKSLVIEIVNEEIQDYSDWEFKINNEGFIDVIIDDMYMDTWYDKGIIKNEFSLTSTVMKIVSGWEEEAGDVYFVE